MAKSTAPLEGRHRGVEVCAGRRPGLTWPSQSADSEQTPHHRRHTRRFLRSRTDWAGRLPRHAVMVAPILVEQGASRGPFRHYGGSHHGFFLTSRFRALALGFPSAAPTTRMLALAWATARHCLAGRPSLRGMIRELCKACTQRSADPRTSQIVCL